MIAPKTILWESSERNPIVARVAIAGDFLPAGNIAIATDGDWREMARPLASYFDDVSTSFVNLESCLDCEGLPPRPLAGLGDIVTAPADSLHYLEAIRATAIGIANNHTFDFGEAGVARTRAAIPLHAMIPLGAGGTTSEAPEVYVWSGPDQVRVGFWAAATATLDPATPRKSGVEPATLARGRKALEEMSKLRARVSVGLMHAGCLRTNRQDPEQRRLMDALAEIGFDIVAASHSHRISGHRQVTREGGSRAFCFYGLGSIVSGYASSPLEREGLVVVAGLDRHGNLASLEIRPVVLQSNGFGSVPPAHISREILARFHALSDEIADGSCDRMFYRDISKGLFRLYARDVSAAYRADGIRALARKASRVRPRHVRRLIHRVIG